MLDTILKQWKTHALANERWIAKEKRRDSKACFFPCVVARCSTLVLVVVRSVFRMLKAKWAEKSSPLTHIWKSHKFYASSNKSGQIKVTPLCFLNCETANLHFLLQMQNLISKFVPRALQIRCHMPDPKSNKMSFCLSVATFKKAPGIRFQSRRTRCFRRDHHFCPSKWEYALPMRAFYDDD